MEGFFLEAGAGSPDTVDAEAVLESALRHGWEFPRTQ
jgi:hypothetical protein